MKPINLSLGLVNRVVKHRLSIFYLIRVVNKMEGVYKWLEIKIILCPGFTNDLFEKWEEWRKQRVSLLGLTWSIFNETTRRISRRKKKVFDSITQGESRVGETSSFVSFILFCARVPSSFPSFSLLHRSIIVSRVGKRGRERDGRDKGEPR